MQKKNKTIFAAMVGNALEYYDVMLYGFFATILAPIFFPVSNPTIAIISSFGTFPYASFRRNCIRVFRR